MVRSMYVIPRNVLSVAPEAGAGAGIVALPIELGLSQMFICSWHYVQGESKEGPISRISRAQSSSGDTRCTAQYSARGS